MAANSTVRIVSQICAANASLSQCPQAFCSLLVLTPPIYSVDTVTVRPQQITKSAPYTPSSPSPYTESPHPSLKPVHADSPRVSAARRNLLRPCWGRRPLCPARRHRCGLARVRHVRGRHISGIRREDEPAGPHEKGALDRSGIRVSFRVPSQGSPRPKEIEVHPLCHSPTAANPLQ